MGDLDDFGELYADLEDRVIFGVPTAETEEEDKDEMEEGRGGCENGAMESGSGSDSEDDLQIVLNEEDHTNKFPAQLLAEGRDCEEDDGDDLVIVIGSHCSGKESNMPEQVHSADGLLQGSGEKGNATKGAHKNWSRPCLSGSAIVRPRNSLSGRSHCDNLTMPCSLGKVLHNSGFPSTFPNGCDFYLPRNRSIFNIDVESFEYKPWRFNGVDITDYFNFGLDEEGWRTYCNQLAHFQQNNLPLYESSRLSKSTGIMSGEIAQYGRDNGRENLDFLDNGGKGIKMPKGQAIRVESGNGDRLPSMDVRRSRNRDSDVVIQITTGPAVEDTLDPIINRLTHMDDNKSKNELLLNSKNELCKSSFNVGTCACKCEGSSMSSEHPLPYMMKPFDEKVDIMNCGRDCPLSITPLSKLDVIIADHSSSSSKSSHHSGSFEASMDEVNIKKLSSPECIHLNSDSLLQEPFLPCCYPSSKTGDDTNKTVSTSHGDQSPESLLDLNYYQQTTPCKVFQLNLSSDDDVALPLVHGQKIDGEHQTKESGTLVEQCDDEPKERIHSVQGGKISLKNNIKYNNGKEVNAAAFLACSKGNDEDPSLVGIREKKTTAREVQTRKNGCYNNRSARCNSRAHEIVNRDSLQSTSRNMSLYDKMVFHTSRNVDGHDTVMRASYNSMETKDQHREISLDEFNERSLDKHFGRCVSYLYEEEESFINKYDRVPCGAGAFRRFQELDNGGKTLLGKLKRSSKYVHDHGDSRFYEDRLHSRIYREAYDEGKRGGHEDGSHKHQVSSLLKSDKRYTCHSGHSHTRETLSELRSKHDIITSKKSHHFSRSGFNLDDDQFPAVVRKAYPYNSAYNESRKSCLALPWFLAKDEASFRHQESNNLSSPKRYTYDSIQLQNGQIDKCSFSQQKICDNHLHNSRGNKLTVRSGKDFDYGGRVGSLSDNFVKDRRELVNMGYRQAVTKHLNGWKVKAKEKCMTSGGRSHLGTGYVSFNESRDSNDNKESSYHNMKSSHKHPTTEEEIEELEEGQLIEESENRETAVIKSNYDGRTPALTTNSKMDLDSTNPIKKNKLVGRYNNNHLLETLAKMEKRLERFKDPIPRKKETQNCGNMEPVAAIEEEVKKQRPARKRRWCSG